MLRIDYKYGGTRQNVKASKQHNVFGKSESTRNRTMKKTVKKIAVYAVTATESETLKTLASNDFTGAEVFAKFAEAKTGIKRQSFKTTGKGKNKKTRAIKPVRNAAYVSAMKKLKATLRPYWIEAGYTAKRFNVRFSQLINICYGQPMQLQVKKSTLPVDSDATFTIDVDNVKTWQKNVSNIVDALIAKYGLEIVQAYMHKALTA